MSDLDCDPDVLRAAAAVLDRVGDQVRRLRYASPVPDPETWGPLGRAVGASARYGQLAGTIEEHLTGAGRFCDLAGAALRHTAASYESADQRGARAFPGEGVNAR